jgi:hypothetical protein
MADNLRVAEGTVGEAGERDDGNGGEGEGVLDFLRQLLRKM